MRLLAQAQIGPLPRAICDPSDLVQQTLLEAHRDFAHFQGTGEPELLGWLRQISAHKLYNEARRYSARQRDAGREVSSDQLQTGIEQSSVQLAKFLAAEGPSPSSISQRRESGVVLANRFAQLPEVYRAVLLLRIYQGLPADEVGRRMNRSVGAVCMLQVRALTAVRTLSEKTTDND